MNTNQLTSAQTNSLVVLRLLIGWHFLYEGVIKLYSSSWSAKGYLLSASFLQGFFRWLGSDSMITIVNTLNVTALMLVGISLLAGFKTRAGALVGIVLLLFYYLAHPAFPGLPQGPSEGSYWLVNKNLIEAAALYVLFLLPTESAFGIAKLMQRSRPQTA
ncbi:MAG: DoxX family protein [Bacteroidetes bacterium]|nr:DoxX family protein [Bacteroidota bacterium]